MNKSELDNESIKILLKFPKIIDWIIDNKLTNWNICKYLFEYCIYNNLYSNFIYFYFAKYIKNQCDYNIFIDLPQYIEYLDDYYMNKIQLRQLINNLIRSKSENQIILNYLNKKINLNNIFNLDNDSFVKCHKIIIEFIINNNILLLYDKLYYFLLYNHEKINYNYVNFIFMNIKHYLKKKQMANTLRLIGFDIIVKKKYNYVK